MHAIKKLIQHLLNPMHVYCRLRDCGLAPAYAVRVSSAYERYIYRAQIRS